MEVRRGRPWYIFGAILIVFSLAAAPSWAQIGDSDCLSCHSDSALTVTDSSGVERSLFVDVAKMENSVHAGFECVTCHADIAEIPHAEHLAPAACASCHESAMEERKEASDCQWDNYPDARDAARIDPGRITIGTQRYRASATEAILIAGTIGQDDERWQRQFYVVWDAVPGTFRIEAKRVSYNPICTITVPVGG